VTPDIFIENFERTEHSDYLHGVIGRSLIIATRFDSMCVNLSIATGLKNEIILRKFTEEDFDAVVNKATSKFRSLNDRIKSFKQPKEISLILHRARVARNEVAHSLTIGFEGCIDINVDEVRFISEVSDLISIIADGDIVISSLMSVFNNEPILSSKYLSGYKNKVVNWVVEQ